MPRNRSFLLTPAAVAAAALLVVAGCGSNGDNGPSPSPSESIGASEGASPTGTDGTSPGTLDISEASLVFTGGAEGDLLTGSDSLALGDFNADGEADLLIGASQQDGPDGRRPDGGAAYVVLGPLDGQRTAADADVTIYGAFAGDSLGYAVTSGDLNGDGVDDVLVGAPGVTAGFDPRTDQGRVYVFYGGDGFGQNPELDLAADVFDFTVTGAEGFSRLSNAMALGDVNGDGTNDLVVGAPFAGRVAGSAPGSERTTVGEVYVIYGGNLSGEKNIARDEYDVLISGKEAQGQFGGAIALADFDDDGIKDIAIGAHRSSADADRPQSGALYVFSGREDFPQRLSIKDGDEDTEILGPAPGASFGFPLASGDFDGDGTTDLAAGAEVESPDHLLAAGTVRVFRGGHLPSRLDLAESDADTTIASTQAGQLVPSSLAALPTAGDGAANLVVGSLLASDGEKLSAGTVYLLSDPEGSLSLADAASQTVSGAAADDRLGNAIAAAHIGDRTAVAMLAPGVDTAEGNDRGAVYVVSLGEG